MIKLRYARLERGWTQEQVAKAIGLTKSAIQNMEVGRTTGSVETWDALEGLFCVPQQELRETIFSDTREEKANRAKETM